MISIEEFNDVQIGDQIKIVDNWEENSMAVAEMNYLLGKTLEVTQKATETTVERNDTFYNFKIIDGYGYWYLNRHCIEKVIKYSVKSIDDKSLEKMLGISV